MTIHNFDMQRLSDELYRRKVKLQLTLHKSKEAEDFGSKLAQLAQQIADQAAGSVDVQQGDGTHLLATPALTLAVNSPIKENPGSGNIHYLALPEGAAALPFYEALMSLASKPVQEQNDGAHGLSRLVQHARLYVLIASTCPHCPQAVRAALEMALSNELVTVSIIDVLRFPDIANRFGVRSVPCTILDKELAITGVITSSELATRIMSRGSSSYDAQVFQSLLERGRFAQAATYACRNQGSTPFVDAWKRSTTSSRIGLLLTAEEALAQDQGALDHLVAELLMVLESQDTTLCGDTADLLGRIAHPSARKALEKICLHTHQDVAEIATEELENSEERKSNNNKSKNLG